MSIFPINTILYRLPLQGYTTEEYKSSSALKQ